MLYGSQVCIYGAACALGALAVSSAASAATITFDETGLLTGSIITNQYVASHGVTFSADNYRNTPGYMGPDKAITFNSAWENTPDPDLEFDWSSGNLKGTPLNRMLIVAENVRDFDNNGRVDDPDDESEGGSISIGFNKPMQSLGFDLIDVELNPGIDTIQFFRNGGLLKTVSFDKFTTVGSPYYDSTVVWLDRSANRIQPLTLTTLGIQAFDAVKFNLPECAAIDNLTFVAAAAVPEPTAAALTLLLLPAMARRTRRS